MSTLLVTGANRGLGLEFARQYAADSWDVRAACRDPQSATDLQALAARSEGRIRILKIDVTDHENVKAAASQLEGEAIDLLINNAGVGGGRGQQLGSIDYAAWAKVLDANALGPARVTEAFLPQLERGKGRTVVTITSGMGSIGDNSSGGRYAYRSSKAAVNMVVKSLSVDLAPRGFTCIVMNPGWVRTDMGGPEGKLSPEESIRGMREVIAKLKPKDSGKFYNYNGREYPW